MIVGGIDDELIGRLSATAEAVAGGTCGPTLVVLVGRSGVGKTAIIQRFHQDLRCHTSGAAHWPPIRLHSTGFLEHRRWVHPRPADVPPAVVRAAPVPWVWVGLECGPDAMGPVDVVAQLRLRLREVVASHEVTVTPAGNGAPGALGLHDPTGGGAAGLDDAELARRFLDVARRHPTVVVADDLHLADGATVDWLRQLLSGAPVLVVGTAWPQPIEHGPLGVLADPLPGVHVELVEVELPPPVELEAVVRERNPSVDAGQLDALLARTEGNPLQLQVLLDTLTVRDAWEMGVTVDAELLGGLPGGAADEFSAMWAELPETVRSVVAATAELGADWVGLAVALIAEASADAVLAEIAGDHPAQTWVAELDERLAVWVDPVLQAVAQHRLHRSLDVEDLLELHKWVVALALSMAQRWIPNDRAALDERRRALAAEGFLPDGDGPRSGAGVHLPPADAAAGATAAPPPGTNGAVAGLGVPPPRRSPPEAGPAAAPPVGPPSGPVAPPPGPVLMPPAPVAPPAGPLPGSAAPPAGPPVVPVPVPATVGSAVSPGDLGVGTSPDRAARVERLVASLRTCDPSIREPLVVELEAMLRMCRREDGPVAPTTMRLEIARSAIAMRRSEVTRALERLRPLMALALDVHGTEGLPVIEGRWNGVLLLRRVRRRGDAVREADCLVRSLVRVHGNDHPDTVAARALLAETLGASGLHAEAVQMFAQLAREVATRHGAGSADALAAYVGWADALYFAGRRADAVSLMRQADETASLTLAADHPVRRRVRRHLTQIEEGRPANPVRLERRFGRSTRPTGA